MGSDHSHNVPPFNAQISWRGRFEQDGQWNEMQFQNMVLDLDGRLWGNGSDVIGQFELKGTRHGQQVTINKHYHGAHTVHYNGHEQQGHITGNWNIPGNCQGQFELQMTAPYWQGQFHQDGTGYPMSMQMTVSQESVFGSGCDEMGYWIARGYCQGGKVYFRKQYNGAHFVDYQGDYNHGHIKGTWEIPGNCSGHFNMQQQS